MKKPVIECIRDFVMTFPELKEGCLMVDYLSEQPIEYAVESVPCERIYKRYKDGGVVKQFAFIFASREFYSADVLQCIENLAFYEHFETARISVTPKNFRRCKQNSFHKGSEKFSLRKIVLCGDLLPQSTCLLVKFLG